jgi:hypothetical protein
LQTELLYEHSSGWYASFWHNHSFSDNDAREIDITVGHSTEVGDIGVEYGIGWFNYAGLGGIEGDALYLYGKISHAIPIDSESLSLSGFVQVDGYIPLSGSTEGGVTLRFGVEAEYVISDKLTFEGLTEVIKDGGIDGNEPGWVSITRACLAYSVTDSVSFRAGGDLYVPFVADDRDTELVGFVGVQITF